MAETNLKLMLIEKVENFFNEKGWNSYEYDEARSLFRVAIGLRCKLKSTRMLIRCRDTGITFQFPLSIGTDDENEIQVMEFVTRVNYGLANGSFQMDLENNYIEFAMYLPCEDVPTVGAIDRAISTGLYILERYGDELLAVMFGMKNAKDAVEAAERKANV